MEKKITDLVLRFYKGRHLICFLDQEAWLGGWGLGRVRVKGGGQLR